MSHEEFAFCMLGNTRKAARAVSRRYDRKVRHLGLKSGQLSVMFLIRVYPGESAGELADRFAMERTTMVRNLALLEKNGFVGSRPSGDGPAKVFDLTDLGSEMVEKTLPLWREAQKELNELLGNEQFRQTIETLKRLSSL